MFVCIFCICLIEISFLLTDMSRYITISSPGLGVKQRSNLYLIDIDYTYQTGWMLIYVFPERT